MDTLPSSDPPSPEQAAGQLADHARQILSMLYEYPEPAETPPQAAADQSAEIARVSGRIKALCTIEQDLILPFLGGEPVAQQARERIRDLLQRVEGLAAAPPAAAGIHDEVAALTTAFREHMQLQRRDVLPRLEDADLSAAAAALDELKARFVQEEAPD